MKICSECGVRVVPEHDHCDLCGWPIDWGDTQSPPDLSPEVDPATFATKAAGEKSDLSSVVGPFCKPCGSHNPVGANFCAQCGIKLPPSSPKPIPSVPPQKPDKHPVVIERGLGMQVFSVIGLGVLLVAALFTVTMVSKRTFPPESSPPAVSSTPVIPSQAPLSAELADRINQLDLAIENDTTALTLVLRREKIFTLVEGGRIDMAATLQSQIAEETGLAEDWKRVGDLYYEWMAEETQPGPRSGIADQAVSAYQMVLALEPDNLDARTDMATAYLNTGTPMLGVTEIKKVLETDPNHLNANFNYGLMLARINRIDEAVAQLQIVLELAPDPTSMHHQRASTLILSIQEQANL